MYDLLLSGDRRALSKAITLIESTNLAHQKQAQSLLTKLLPYSGKSFRLGISGPPGAGKSTFIDGFASYLIKEKNKRVAVLAIDPSSPVGGGSLLADKTRMERLSQHPQAFIRPSPSSGILGGVANKTRECIIACEAAGFDFIIVETVGVGQSEFEVGYMVDHLIALMLPNSGDEIQGIKKGLLEMADTLVVNKWDGPLKDAAEKSANQLKSAIGIVQGKSSWPTSVLLCSSLEQKGFELILSTLDKFSEHQQKNNQWHKKRKDQNLLWFKKLLNSYFQNLFETRYKEQWQQLTAQVKEQELTPYEAMQQLVSLIPSDK